MCVFVLVLMHQFILRVARSSFHAHQVSHHTIHNMNSLNAGKCQGLPGEICSKSGLVCCWALTERIAKVAPTENCCMLENADDSVDYVHLIPPTGIPSTVSYFLTLSHKVGEINDF